jgi:hypothetical protein
MFRSNPVCFGNELKQDNDLEGLGPRVRSPPRGLTRGMKKGCREEAAERATSDCDFERVHSSEPPIQ